MDANDLVVIDEMAYITNELFFQVILPLIEVNTTRIVGISTPSGNRHNLFTRLIKLRYPGTDIPLFASFQVELVCDMCKRNGHYNTCKHMDHLMPPWKGSSKKEVAKLIYGEEEEDTRVTESLGVALGDQDCIFEQSWIRTLSRKIRWANDSPVYMPKVIFMACDPNSGGSSHMALVSIAFIANRFVVSSYILFGIFVKN